ncbi:MAG: XdhC family protein [Anaerolineales bacterium]
MDEFLEVARASLEATKRGETVALAFIARVRGSSPRHHGARMLIWPDGRIVGTIGGGTLEWRVQEHARAALIEQKPRFSNYVFDTHGGPDSVGLCGGSVDVHIDISVQEFAQVAQAALQALERGEVVALASLVREGDAAPRREATRMLIWPDGRTYGRLGDQTLEDSVAEDARHALLENSSRFARYTVNQDRDPTDMIVHLDILEPNPTLLIIGAGHVAQPLAAMASMMGLRVCLVDDRAVWANRERFPSVTEMAVIGYEPVHEILDPIPFPMTPATHVVITTWGYDLPAMEQALRQNPAYIGLVSSPTKARVLFKRLRDAGFPDDDIRRIRAPIGLDVGAENPAEIAISILAEVLAVMRGKSGQPLREVRGARIESLFARPTEAVAAQVTT